jgi:UDP-glucose 4-epimerase
VFVKDLARVVLKAADGQGKGAYHFSSGKDVAIIELYEQVVKAMNKPDHPAPDIRELGADDAPSILLDPSRTFADFGQVQFTPLDQTVAAAIEYFKQHGTLGEYTHLKFENKK